MKILLAADIFPPQTGGPATYVVTLANELVKAGDEVRIVSLNPHSDKSIVNCQLLIVHSENKVLRYLEYLWRLYKQAKLAEVVYAMGPVNAGLPALLAARLQGKKFVVKVVGDYAWEQSVQRFGVEDLVDEFQNKSRYGFSVRALKRVEAVVCRRADAVIVPCAYLKRLVIGWGVGEKNLVVIRNGVSFLNIEPIMKLPDEKWIVSAGRLVPWKGMSALIEIMPDLVNVFHGVKLKIVGAGPEWKNLESKIKDQKLEEVVELVGRMTRQETLKYIAAANVFVLNSAYEGLSHVLLEAAVQNINICASNISSNLELPIAMALFQYNNKDEIKTAISTTLSAGTITCSNVNIVKDQFSLEKMIRETRMSLQQICVS